MNDASCAIFDKDNVSFFTCIFDGLISSDFRIVVISILFDSEPMQPTSTHVHSDDICYL